MILNIWYDLGPSKPSLDRLIKPRKNLKVIYSFIYLKNF